MLQLLQYLQVLQQQKVNRYTFFIPHFSKSYFEDVTQFPVTPRTDDKSATARTILFLSLTTSAGN